MNHEKKQDLSRKWICASADGDHGNGEVDTKYAVQWQTVHHPHRWKYYSIYDELSRCLTSLQAASKVPGVLGLRIMKRTQHYEALPEDVTASYIDYLKEGD